jgi:hypothetical protein
MDIDNPMDRFRVHAGRTSTGEPGVLIAIPRGSFIEDLQDDPSPGIVILPQAAREIAYALLLIAEQVASGQFDQATSKHRGAGT